MKKYLEEARVIGNEAITEAIYKLTFEAPQIARSALPGQFVNVSVETAFLRRPFGIVEACGETGEVTIIYRLVGTGTAAMTNLRAGDKVSVEGPLGEGTFSTAAGKVLLVGGGVGLAPLICLAGRLAEKPVVLVGGKTKEETFWSEFFKDKAEKVYVTTDDGSAGIHGFAVAALPQIFSENKIDRIAVCGPTVMMKTIAEKAEEAGISCEVSMEKRMACGIGVCLGCTFESKKDKKRYKVCSDGPVFDSKEVF